MKILQIKSSILGENSTSSKYTKNLIDFIKTEKDEVIVRDVALNTVTQLSGEVLGKLADVESDVSKEHMSLIKELDEANIVVIAAPMYNFSIPATLKNYFDAITKAGITFKYTESGPVGLINNKKTFVVISRGGKYKEHNITFQEDYLKMQLNFIGLNDINFVYVEGVAMGLTQEEINNNFYEQLKGIK